MEKRKNEIFKGLKDHTTLWNQTLKGLDVQPISLLAEALFLVFTDGRKETSAMGQKWLY